MKKHLPTASLCASLLLLFSLILPTGPRATAGSSGSLSGFEAALNPAGSAYEINPDGQGKLWITDYGSGEIWQADPLAASYTILQGIPSPSDARLDAFGNLWWADFDHGRLGELPAGASQAVTWPLPGAGQPYGTFVDSAGRVWVSDNKKPYLFSFSLSQSNTLCAYPFPDNAAFSYLSGSGEALWAADGNNGRMYRLVLNGNAVAGISYWTLPTGSLPLSLVTEANGSVTWIDPYKNGIVHLDPGTNQMTSYAIPSGYFPGYLTRDGSQYWFTKQSPPGFGRLNPAFAAGSSVPVQAKAMNIRPTCATAPAAAPLPVTITKRSIEWSPVTYPAEATEKDWTIYTLPENALPSGITILQNNLWIVDSGRKKLVRAPITQYTFLPIVNRR